MNLKKNGKVFTSKFVGTGSSSDEKRIYRAAVSQTLRNTALHVEQTSDVSSLTCYGWNHNVSDETSHTHMKILYAACTEKEPPDNELIISKHVDSSTVEIN